MTTQHQMRKRQMRSNRGSLTLALVGMGLMAQPFFAKNSTNGSLASSVNAARSVKRGVEIEIKDLHPFTHLTSIPATSDPATIQFKSVKVTKVFTKVKSTMEPNYCENLRFRDPGGSKYCFYSHDESPTPAYEVTYSFEGEPLTSDEYGNRYFTFHVYFRPEELPLTLRKALSAGNTKRVGLAAYFNVAISRRSVRAGVIDDTKSSFCEGAYMDGNWIQNDPQCQEKVTLKTVTMPSDYITVEVDLVSPQAQQATAAAGKDHSSETSAGENRR